MIFFQCRKWTGPTNSEISLACNHFVLSGKHEVFHLSLSLHLFCISFKMVLFCFVLCPWNKGTMSSCTLWSDTFTIQVQLCSDRETVIFKLPGFSLIKNRSLNNLLKKPSASAIDIFLCWHQTVFLIYKDFRQMRVFRIAQ